MTAIAVFQKLINNGVIGTALRRKSKDANGIKALQEGLHHLGFGKQLNWDKFGPDGDYGSSTAAAVKLFAKRNNIDSDGSSVNADLGELIIKRLDFLDEMRHMQDAVEDDATLKLLYRSSSHRLAISVLQTILNELGYGEQLNWAKYGADGGYGPSTAKAVKAFAEANNISSDGNSVTQEMARKALANFIGFYGDDWNEEGPALAKETLSIKETNKAIIVSDGDKTKTFRKFRRGVYTNGDQKTLNVIDNHRDSLKAQGMTDSALNVMISVSENEGNLDAINTWDNAIMTFGMFQWTVGVGQAQGELPALFKKIKTANPDVFEHYYGRNGLDVTPKTSATHGFFILNGNTLRKKSEKEQLRSGKWSFFFWKSGQDPIVQTIQIQHAFSRIETFYRSSSYQINGHDIAEIITSEYGIGLVLDNHVNRPGYIKPCITNAVKRAGLAGSNPKDWGTTEENKVIDQYIKIRETFGRSPMTDAAKRARVTKKYLDKGIISNERGSFKY